MERRRREAEAVLEGRRADRRGSSKGEATVVGMEATVVIEETEVDDNDAWLDSKRSSVEVEAEDGESEVEESEVEALEVIVVVDIEVVV